MDEKRNPMEVAVDDTVEETAVDVSSKGDQTPSTEPEMLTKEQAEKLANEKHSKLDRRIFELEKAQEKSTKALEAAANRAKAAEASLALAKKQTEEAERRSLGDTPDAMKLFEARIAHRQAEDALAEKMRQFEEEKTQWDDVVNEAKQYKVVKMADEIASEYEVDSSLLVSMTDGSREKMEKLAKVLPKKEDKVTIPKPPDSGKKSRVLTNPTVEQLEHMTMEQHVAWAAERNKNKR